VRRPPLVLCAVSLTPANSDSHELAALRSPAGSERIAEITTGYSNLEFDLDKGERGQRNQHAQSLFAVCLHAGIANTLTAVS